MKGLLLLVLVNLLLLSLNVIADTVVIPYQSSGYRYYQTVAGLEPRNWQGMDFNDSSWNIGTAGFGYKIFCSLTPNTNWDTETVLLLRKWFNLPAGGEKVKIYLAIDNDAQVYFNGTDVSNGIVQHENCAEEDSFVFNVPDVLVKPGNNLVAVWARDRGFEDYVDIKVVAVVYPTPTPTYTPTYTPTLTPSPIPTNTFTPTNTPTPPPIPTFNKSGIIALLMLFSLLLIRKIKNLL